MKHYLLTEGIRLKSGEKGEVEREEPFFQRHLALYLSNTMRLSEKISNHPPPNLSPLDIFLGDRII